MPPDQVTTSKSFTGTEEVPTTETQVPTTETQVRVWANYWGRICDSLGLTSDSDIEEIVKTIEELKVKEPTTEVALAQLKQHIPNGLHQLVQDSVSGS